MTAQKRMVHHAVAARNGAADITRSFRSFESRMVYVATWLPSAPA